MGILCGPFYKITYLNKAYKNVVMCNFDILAFMLIYFFHWQNSGHAGLSYFRPRKNRTVRDLCFHWLPFCLLQSLMIDYDWFEATKIFLIMIFKEGERWTCWRSFTFVTRFFFVLFIKSINTKSFHTFYPECHLDRTYFCFFVNIFSDLPWMCIHCILFLIR